METFAEYRAYMRGWADAQHSLTEEALTKKALEAAHMNSAIREQTFRRASAEIEAAVTQIMREYR